jgi:hypothetical protein
LDLWLYLTGLGCLYPHSSFLLWYDLICTKILFKLVSPY